MSAAPTSMRSFRRLAVASAILLGATACGGSDADSGTDTAADSSEPTTAATEPEPVPATEPEPDAEPAPDAEAEPEAAELTGNGGTITVDGTDYPYESNFCSNDDDGIFIQGQGTTADGVAFTAGIISQPSGDSIELTVDVVVGESGIPGGENGDLPWFETNSFREAALEFTVDGPRVSGSGPAIDLQEVALIAGETVTMTFEGRCDGT